MKLPGSCKSRINKDKNGENVRHLELINNNYQQDARVLCTFVPNKWLGQLLDISHKNFIFLKTFDSRFSYIEVWFTDKNLKPLEIEIK